MPTIALVFTGHRECGLCNAGELVKILRTIEPDVVFEETRPEDVETHWAMQKLESQAIQRYAKVRSFIRVPVDRYGVLPDRTETQRVFDTVRQASEEYLWLQGENDEKQFELGFKYLNSDACTAIMERLSRIEESTIERVGDPALTRALETWRDLIQQRDREMVANIYEYCRENAFSTGVFLVGAAHKASVTKETERRAAVERGLIEWKACV